MDDVEKAAANEFLGGVAEHPAQSRIDGAKAEIEASHRLAERTLLEDVAKPLLTVAQGRLGHLAAGDIDIDAAVTHRIAAGITDHPAAAEDPPQLTVGTNDAVFRLEIVDAA